MYRLHHKTHGRNVVGLLWYKNKYMYKYGVVIMKNILANGLVIISIVPKLELKSSLELLNDILIINNHNNIS